MPNQIQVEKPSITRGYLGELICTNDLPPPNTERWVISRKLTLLGAVRGGLITPDEVCGKYSLSHQELDSWITAIKDAGVKGLRQLHMQEVQKMAEYIRLPNPGLSAPVIDMGDLTIDFHKEIVRVNDNLISFTDSEFRVLAMLVSRCDTVVSKSMILDRLYGKDENRPHPKIVDVFICKIRKKLSEVSEKQYIETVWGRGYIIFTS